MKIVYTLFLLVIIGFLFMPISSCTKNKVPLPELDNTCSDSVKYVTFVQPLISSNCSTSGCHDSFGAGGYTLETHAQISGNAEIILKAIRHDGAASMPQGQPKLVDSLTTQFNCWINQGKLEN
jgi:hypothetical protein